MIGIRSLSALFVLLSLSGSGCQSFYPYGMYPGTYGQPGMYGQPAGAMLQAPQGAAQLTFLESTPAGVPATEIPPPGLNRSGISREPVSAPDIQRSLPGGDSGVPAPRDPAPGRSPSVRTREGVLETGSDLTQVSPDPVFLKPVVMTEEGSTEGIIAADGTSQPLVATDSNSELGRDAGYRWVQGDLQYDVQRGTWHLVYDYTPFDDRFGGEVTLQGDLPFTPADNDLVYRVYGSFDQTQQDRLGKPVYQVSRVQRISR
jgi:hypothetical protein